MFRAVLRRKGTARIATESDAVTGRLRQRQYTHSFFSAKADAEESWRAILSWKG